MIHSVTLNKFKQHQNKVVVFNEGLNSVQGENGVGKTAVLKAVLFALFGATAAGCKDHLTTWGLTGMSVKLDITLPTVGRVTVIRSLTKAEVLLEGSLVASGQTAVTGYIEDKLGMNAKLFKSMLYAEQGDAQLLLKMGAAGLQRQLETVANIEVIDKVITKIGIDNTRAEGELAGIGELVDINALRNQLDEVTAKANTHEKTQVALQIKAQVSTGHADLARKDYDQAVVSMARFGKANTELTNQLARQALLVQQLEQLTTNKPVAVSHIDIDNLSAAVTKLQKEIGSDHYSIQNYINDLAHYESVVERHQRLSLTTFTLNGAKILESRRLRDYEAQLDALADLKNKQQAEHSINCLSCKRPLEGKDIVRIKAEVMEAFAVLDTVTQEAEKSFSSLVAYLKANGTTLPLLLGYEQELSHVERELAQIEEPTPLTLTEASIAERETQLALDKARLTELQLAQREYNLWLAQYNKLGAEVAQVDTAVVKAQTNLSDLNVPSDAELKALSQAEETTRLDATTKRIALNNAQQAYRDSVNEKSRLLIQVTAAESKADKVNVIKHQSALRAELHKYLRTNRAKLMIDYWAALTNYAGHLINSTTEGLMHTLSRSDSGDFYVIENGQQVPVEELSGARKSIVGLCLRLSLAHLFYGTGGFVLLDEVTADCSENNAARIAGMLRGLQSQVIMVTHRQGDAVNANHSILLH
jgi:DNA repair exonuclease SbcCD ATPase subunit